MQTQINLSPYVQQKKQELFNNQVDNLQAAHACTTYTNLSLRKFTTAGSSEK